MTEKDLQRFWAKVDKSPHEKGCWMWLGFKRNKKGYGGFWFNEGIIGAHRMSFQLANGQPIDRTVHVLHRCDNPGCVNPDHLFGGTNDDNVRDKVRKNRQSQGANTFAAKHPELMPHGSAHGSSKLTEDQVRRIRQLKAGGMFQNAIAKIFHVTPANICNIFKGRTWKHVP